MAEQKMLFMIGGPNGAGKTTTAFSLMPELIHCDEYINADAVAASLSPFKPDSVAIQAGRIMLQRIYNLVKSRANLAFETTMASKTFQTLLKQCKRDGYQVNLFYLWLSSPELAIERVKSRMMLGGHGIANDVIVRRYYRSIYNFTKIYLPLADRWSIYDNSNMEPSLIAKKHQHSTNIEIQNKSIWLYLNEVKE